MKIIIGIKISELEIKKCAFDGIWDICEDYEESED